ncbi:MAG: rubrerythrin family protein [Phycisphaerales bacterium]|jgi:rubrerythrin|nr:rubrerythrin family protein [Phycisphaerales bacterium]
MTTTNENLAEAFAGESQANRKYLAFGKKAEEDGLPQVAKLFRAAAGAETIHAHAHLRVLGGIGETIKNLQEAAEGEAHEFQEMYPPFLAQAEAEGNKPAVFSFKNALAVEEIHNAMYVEAIAAVEAGGDLPAASIYLCPVCGNTVTVIPGQCPICNVPGEKFFEVK